MPLSDKTNISDWILTVSAILLALFVGSYAYWRVNQYGLLNSQDWMLMVGLSALAIIMVLARLSSSGKLKHAILYACYLAVVVELMLQVVATYLYVPRMSYFYHSPYSRVYDTDECYGNSRMNRYGWYYPAFRNEKGTRKIALIGDSFIQAIQVYPTRHLGKTLEHHINDTRKDSDKAVEVMAFGIGDVGPANYLEYLKYAVRHFHPEEAFIFICFCNDFSDSNYAAEHDTPMYAPSHKIYYALDSKGEPVLAPGADKTRDLVRLRLESNHRSLLFHLPGIIRNNLISLIMAKHIYDRYLARHRPHGDEKSPMAQIGCDDYPYLRKDTEKWRNAFALATALLEKCDQFAKEHGVKLRIVTIPMFPKAFLESGDWVDWGMEKGKYDFLKPERELVDWARKKGIPLLAMGQFIKESHIGMNDLRSLYCMGGPAHWSSTGHHYWADAIFGTYYNENASRMSDSHTDHLGKGISCEPLAPGCPVPVPRKERQGSTSSKNRAP